MDDETLTNESGLGPEPRFTPDGTRIIGVSSDDPTVTQEAPSPRPAAVSGSGQDFSGMTLGGYQLTRKIAEGGMGVVYEAIQVKLNRRVAVRLRLLEDPRRAGGSF